MAIRLEHIARAAVLVVLAAAGGCYWTADAPLMPTELFDPSPIPPGRYIQTLAPTVAYTLGSGSGAITVEQTYVNDDGSVGSTTYEVGFDRVDDAYYLVQAIDLATKGINYVLVRPEPGGFTELRLECLEGSDQPIALAAGATLGGDGQCVFATYDSLLAAARQAASQIAAGETLSRNAEYRSP